MRCNTVQVALFCSFNNCNFLGTFLPLKLCNDLLSWELCYSPDKANMHQYTHSKIPSQYQCLTFRFIELWLVKLKLKLYRLKKFIQFNWESSRNFENLMRNQKKLKLPKGLDPLDPLSLLVLSLKSTERVAHNCWFRESNT